LAGAKPSEAHRQNSRWLGGISKIAVELIDFHLDLAVRCFETSRFDHITEEAASSKLTD
jgi:hypothetical protein